MRLIYGVFWLLIIAFGVLFGLLNPEQVNINYYIHSKQTFLPLVLLVCLAIGVLMGCFVMSPSLLRQRKNNRRLRKQLTHVKQELSHFKDSQSYQNQDYQNQSYQDDNKS